MLPPRWVNCPQVGDLILDLLLPFKTPLDDKFKRFLDPDQIFDIETFLRVSSSHSIGMVIDLTKSRRYYNRKEVDAYNIKYVKIDCKGNEETPTHDQVKLFINIVRNFNDSQPNRVVGVHCTHGFNRTGFMICAYLVEELDYSVDVAVQIFADARPPGIYKADYLEELFRRYGDLEDCPPAPDRPDWCLEEGDEYQNQSHSSQYQPHSSVSLKRPYSEAVRTENDDLNDNEDDESAVVRNPHDNNKHEHDIPDDEDDESAVCSSSYIPVDPTNEVSAAKQARLTSNNRDQQSNYTCVTVDTDPLPGSFPAPPVPHGRPDFMANVPNVETLDQKSYTAHAARELVFQLSRLGGVKYATDGSGQVVPANSEEAAAEDDDENDEDNEESDLDKEEKKVPKSAKTALAWQVKKRRQSIRFPGSQPVSLTQENAFWLRTREYACSYKADGTRYLLLVVGPNKVFLIDRGMFVYRPSLLHFPTLPWVQNAQVKKRPPSENGEPPGYMNEVNGHLAYSLFDTELCIFDEPQIGGRIPRLLLYDVIALEGKPLGRQPFKTRYDALLNYVIWPRNTAFQLGLLDMPSQAFSVRRKDFFYLSFMKNLFDPGFVKELRVETDGLIFQPNGPNDFYVLQTCPDTLKWKPPELNTIDFLCKMVYKNDVGQLPHWEGHLYLHGSSVRNAMLGRASAKDKIYDGKIVECNLDPRFGWQVLRVRTDKTEANHYTSGAAVCASIMKPVLATDLMRLVYGDQQQTTGGFQEQPRQIHSAGTSSSSTAN